MNLDAVAKNEPGRGVFLQIPYMLTLKDPVAAILCSQIHYWYSPTKEGKSKLRVMKIGNFWIAKSRKEWGDETGLSEAQVRRALDVLERAEVIEKKVFRFNGAPTIHLRALLISGRGPLNDGQWLMPASKVIEGLLSIDQLHNSSGTDDKTVDAYHQSLATGVKSITDITQESIQKNTQHTLASGDANDAQKAKGKIQNPEGKEVEKLWFDLTAQYHKDRTYLPFGNKELGQCRSVAQKLGQRLGPVMSLVVADWVGFTKFARQQSGAYSIPLSPTLGFLLRYAEDALNYFLAGQTAEEPKKLIKEGAKNGQKTHQQMAVDIETNAAPPIIVHPDDEEMTVEELLAYKKGLG